MISKCRLATDLNYNADQISEDAYHGACDKYKDQHPGYSFFEIGIFPKEMAGIKKEPDQEDYSKDDWKYIPYSIGNIGNGIFDPTDLRKNARRKQR